MLDQFQGLCQLVGDDSDDEAVMKHLNNWNNLPADQYVMNKFDQRDWYSEIMFRCQHGLFKYGECDNEAEDLDKYREICRPLTNAAGRFATCHGTIDPSRFYDQCVEDMCAWEGDGVMKEISFTAYTEACHDAGVQPGDWRRPQDLCK